MTQDNRIVSLIVVILIGVFLQILLIGADNIDTPNKAAVEFAEYYFKLDPAMADRLCSEQLEADEEEGDPVENYIREEVNKSAERGFGKMYVTKKLSDIKTVSIEPKSENDTAKIHLKASVKPSLLRSFFITDAEEPKIDHVIDLVREDGVWKVCSDLHILNRR